MFENPEKDYSGRNRSQENINEINTGRRIDMNQERKTIGTWDRATLEDKHLRLMEEHLLVKKYAREQDVKMKQLGTKLKRLSEDQKKMEGSKSGAATLANQREEIETLKIKVSELNAQNKILKDKLKVVQNQPVITGRKLNSSSNNASARIDTGIPKSRNQNIRSILPNGEVTMLAPRNRGDELPSSHHDVDSILNSPRNLEVEERIKSRREEYLIADKSSYRNEMTMINLKREIGDKEDKIKEMIMRYEQLRMKQSELEEANYNLTKEIELYKGGVMNIGSSGISGSGSGEDIHVMRKRITDLELINHDNKKEIILLRQANEDLTNKAFDVERERDWREKELRYRTRIAQLEKSMRMDIGEKGGIIDEYQREREKFDKLEAEMSSLRLRNFELQNKIEEMQKQLKLYTKDTSVTPDEIQEALFIIQQKKQMTPTISMPNLYRKNDNVKDQDLLKRLQEEETRHAETIQELEKTRNILKTQYKISNDYKQAAERVSKRLEEVTADYEARLLEYSKLLDIRAGRIRKLEAQLKDIGYGTRGGIRTERIEESPAEIDSMLLERGENVIEIHIGKVNLSQRAIQLIGDSDPLLFGTWEFLHFEIQATGILRGTNPDFDMTAEYIVKIDEFLLECLHKKTYTFELHQAIGSEYETIAVGQLTCRELVDETANEYKTGSSLANSGVRFMCTSRLIGVSHNLHTDDTDADNVGHGEVLGVLEYWIKLRHPMDQIIRQYNEKMKAQNYLKSNKRAEKEGELSAYSDMNLKAPIHTNEAIVRIVRCRGLKSAENNVQPSPYAVYQFQDYPPHLTHAITASNNPEFQDVRRFPVDIGPSLDRYLKNQSLEIVILDELDPNQSNCLGIARIPLIGLSQNKKVTGTYELYDKQNFTISGASMDVEIEWLHPYLYEIHLRSDTPEKEIPQNQRSPIKKQKQEKRDSSPTTPPQVVARKSTTPNSNEKESFGKSPIVSPRKSIEQDSSTIRPPEPQKRTSVDRPQTHAVGGGLISPPSEEKFYKDIKPKHEEPRNIEKSINEVSELMQSTDIPMSLKTQSPAESIEENMCEQTIQPNAPVQVTSPEPSVSQHADNRSENKTEIGDKSESITAITPSTKKLSKDSFKFEMKTLELWKEVSSILEAGFKDIKSGVKMNMSLLIQGIPQDETEASSIPIPKGYPIILNFNFQKNFEKLKEKQKQVFAAMLTGQMKDDIQLLVSLEPDDENEDYYDIAKGTIHLNEIMKNNRDMINEKVPIYHFTEENVQVGFIIFSIEILSLLKAISKRIKK